MEILTATRQTAHFYTQEGKPVFEVIGKTTGKPRPTNIRDARKDNLLPSVTTVIKGGLPSAYGLELYKLDLLAQVILTNTQKDNEEYKEYLERLGTEYQEEREKAASLGSEVHSMMKSFLEGPLATSLCFSKEAYACLVKIRTWINRNIKIAKAEEIHVNLEYGFAGTIDAICETYDYEAIVIDWKTQTLKNGKPRYYDEMLYQLGAYSILHPAAEKYLNVIIPINQDINEIYVKEWTSEDLAWGQKIFLQALKTYRLINRFPYKRVA